MYYDVILWENIEPEELQEKLMTRGQEMMKRFVGFGIIHFNVRTDVNPQPQPMQTYEEQEEDDEVEEQPQPQQVQQPQQQRVKASKIIDPDEVQPQPPDINDEEIEEQM